MKTFNHLINDYDNALKLAKTKLPPISEVDLFEFRVVVNVDITTGIFSKKISECNSSDNPNILYFTFRKEIINGVVVGWYHYK